MKNNKGYTIMEAVIAMFLVVVMVGAVFSSLMAGRRAIVSSSQREEIFYSLNSTYGMLKDCRSNQDCQLHSLGCPSQLPASNVSLKGCDGLFTFNFANLCKGATADNNFGKFQYNAVNSTFTPDVVPYMEFSSPTAGGNAPVQINLESDFYILTLSTKCDEAL